MIELEAMVTATMVRLKHYGIAEKGPQLSQRHFFLRGFAKSLGGLYARGGVSRSNKTRWRAKTHSIVFLFRRSISENRSSDHSERHT